MFELLMLINSARITPLQMDAALTERAQTRAAYLCTHKQWSHDGWMDSFVGVPHPWGENLAEGFKTDKQTHKALMKSPTHRANIVNKNFKEVGIGKKKCGKKTIVVELFSG